MTSVTCNSCNTGTSALSDMYTRHCVHKGKCEHIRQCTSACVATNMLHFRHSKNLPEFIANRSAYLYSKE